MWYILCAFFRDFIGLGALMTVAVYLVVSRLLFAPNKQEHTIEQRVEWCVVAAVRGGHVAIIRLARSCLQMPPRRRGTSFHLFPRGFPPDRMYAFDVHCNAVLPWILLTQGKLQGSGHV